MDQQQLAPAADVLIHQFRADGLDLSVAGTRHASTKSRLEASGAPTFIGCWPYFAGDGFDQDEADLFGDVGQIDDDEEEEGDGEV
jgi:hypothetical protein